MLGNHRHVSETPFKWHFADGPMLASLWWYLNPLSSHQLKKKHIVKAGPPLTKLSGSAHEHNEQALGEAYSTKQDGRFH